MKAIVITLLIAMVATAASEVYSFSGPSETVGLASDDDHLWALDSDGVIYSLDMATGDVIDTGQLTASWMTTNTEFRGIGYDGNRLGVSTYTPYITSPYRLARFIPSTYSFDTSYLIPQYTYGVCEAPSGLFGYSTLNGNTWSVGVAFQGDPMVDPVTVPFSNAYDIAYKGGLILIATPGTTTVRAWNGIEFDDDYAMTTSLIPGGAIGLAPAVEDEHCWVSSDDDIIYLINMDPASSLQRQTWGSIKSAF